MGSQAVELTLEKLDQLVRDRAFEELETDTLEIKPVPADSSDWRELYKSACAFLNTRGGILILGIKEVQTGGRRYEFTGWRPEVEEKLKNLCREFTSRDGQLLHLNDAFPPPQLYPFLNGTVAIVLVDELAADQKYVFYRQKAYRRVLTGDHVLSEREIEAQEEFKQEADQARELEIIPGAGLDALDTDKLNNYITLLNRPVKIETIKADLRSALPFLQRKSFMKGDAVTTLGMLVCGNYLSDYLGFRCQVHGYVDVPQEIARDKQDFSDNILPLMEMTLAYILRNIHVGISARKGGESVTEYPEELLRETINNALAHRDYRINRQVIVAVKPGESMSIRNPGSFQRRLLIEKVDEPIPLRRILPEAKPRNPKLADVLRVFRKWEGRGIGMATLVNLCLENRLDLPYYLFGTEEVTLYLCAGKLLDEQMARLFRAYDRYIEEKLDGRPLSEAQKTVLAYLIKSEWANAQVRYTILLTPDNNHFNELTVLNDTGLISRHPASAEPYPVFVADRTLMRRDYLPELRVLFGFSFDALSSLHKDILSIVYRFNHFSRTQLVSAKEASFTLWYADNAQGDIKAFDSFYRKIRYAFNQLEKGGFVLKEEGLRGYRLGTGLAQGMLGSTN